MLERAGRLSQRVRFEARPVVRGDAGEALGDWSLAFERWAQVELLPRAEMLPAAADTRHSARRWRLTMRAGVMPRLDMRAVWAGNVLTLTGVEADPASPGWISVWAEDGAAGEA
jgi:head-tail adaptor